MGAKGPGGGEARGRVWPPGSGARRVGSFWPSQGPPGLLSTVGKWCPVWGGFGGRVHPSGGRGVGTPEWETRRPGQEEGVMRAPGCAGRCREWRGPSCPRRRGNSFLLCRGPRVSFRGCEKLGAFLEASFKTDILGGGGDHKCVCQGPLVFVVQPLSFVTLSFLFFHILDSSFRFCYYVSFSFVSQGFLHRCSGGATQESLTGCSVCGFLATWGIGREDSWFTQVSPCAST